MKIVAFVPAKGTSERIPNKNLVVLDGEYLFKRKLRQLLECKVINEVFLDTDSDEIAALVTDLPVTVLKRPPALASNATDGHELFSWECSQVDADIYIQTLCTAPFVSADTLTRAITILEGSPAHDSLLAVYHTKQYTWSGGEPDYGRGRIPNSIDLPQLTVEAMSFYIAHASVTQLSKRFGRTPIFFPLNPTEMVDVNWPEDLQLAETIAAGMRAKENLTLAALAPYLSAAMISDIMREMGHALTLPQKISGRGSFFGRAKTLLLDQLQKGESATGIYDALDSYQFVRPGDVIVVENRVPECAYFGNLNAQLAMRAGAIGAVIDGMTRDKANVEKLGFPVFARGHYCVDIKCEGTVREMNLPIQIGGVQIENGDYVFADPDGVTIIPQALWPTVRECALKGIEKEWQVGMAVALGNSPKSIVKHLGEF